MPIITDSVKKMFDHAKGYYAGEDGRIEKFMATKAESDIQDGYGLLTTP